MNFQNVFFLFVKIYLLIKFTFLYFISFKNIGGIMKFNIAIIGATGLVGRTTLKILEERGLCRHNIFLFASSKSEGEKVLFAGKSKKIISLCEETLYQRVYDFALFCTGEDISRKYIDLLAKAGCQVIDFSSAYRKDYPLIVPEVNMADAQGNIICNPNCSTIASVVALNEIHKRFGLERIVYSTYQAVSGAGKGAMSEFDETNSMHLQFLDYPIKNNLIPYIGSIDGNGCCTEEKKMLFETKKILNDFDIKISAMTVRVPVDIGHSISIFFETKQNVSVDELRKVLDESEGVKYITHPMPMLSREQDYVLVGRLKKDEFNDKSFSLFLSSDNLRKGAGQNGVQILEKLIERKNSSL